jgi:hypothetical protein
MLTIDGLSLPLECSRRMEGITKRLAAHVQAEYEMNRTIAAGDTAIRALRPWPRTLRIATSAFFGLLTLAICVLWVRSFWQSDYISRQHNGILAFISNHGYVVIHSKNHHVLCSPPSTTNR